MVSFLGIFAAVVIIANQQHCVDAGDLCPSGWFSYRHYCYTNGIGKGYWDARKACQDLGADLTTMVDTNETKALADWLQEKSGLIDIWIGLHNAEATTYPVSAGGFKWTDGTDVDPAYDNWFVNNENKKEPTSGDRYVRFYRFNGTAPVKWAAAGNGQTIKGYICKKVTWNTTAKHCFDGNCYRISAEEFSNATTAENECKKHSMNVLQNGKFPVALYRTFSLDNITTDQFWMEYDGLTKCRSLYSNTTCPAANKSARVICIGPSDLKCPCDWHDLDDNCYYIGNTKTNHTGAANQCKRFNAAFLEITSHIENRFIKNVINKSHTYWIANNSTSPYCQLNQDKCPDFQSINATGNWTDANNSASHHIVCKKKKSDLGSEICIDNHPGECYKFSRQAVTSLVNATCDPDMKILNETVLEERYSDLAALVNSSNVTCASYWIQSNVSKFFPVKNDSETNTTKAHYICFKDHNECNSSSCNSGTCIDGFRNYTCKCEAGFTGSNCETNINDCKSNPCLHNSTCTDEVNGYKCSCSQGYQGTNCELGPLCPSGWVSHKNACYRIFLKSPKGYWEARKECQNSGADLATMNDKNETKVLSDTMKPEKGKVDLWIGLHNSKTTAKGGNSTGYNWTDGTHLDETYDNWYGAGGNKEPTSGDQYVRFFRNNTNTSVKWAAAGNATDKKGYICKKETWDTSSQHCFDDFCYKISATPFYNATDAEAECTKNNMTVVEHGKFPDPLNKTFGLDEIISKAFWLEHKTSTQFSTGTAARVICKGPVDMRCPCGWSGIEKYCYYLGKESQDKKESHEKCKDLDANLARIRSHTENKFIKSILDQAHTYWIRNQKKAPYCGLNEDYCGEYNTIIGNGTWKNSSSSEGHHYICKRKRRDLQEPSDFCIDSFPGECYNFSKVALNHSHLTKATCGQGMTILDEEILHQSNVSRELAKAIHSIKVSCNSYWIFSKDPKVISAVNDTVFVEKADPSTLAPYICVQENDECASSPCNNNGTCVDEFRNFSCKCLPGFSGTVCEQDIDDCVSQPCKHGSTCNDQVNGYDCTYALGFTGKDCETDIDECRSSPCQHNSTCIDQVNAYICNCTAGYNGSTCETDIDDCVSQPCKHGSTCNDQVNGYDCTCALGFTGKDCETDIDECRSSPCQHNSTCIDQVNAYICNCTAGYNGSTCETDIDDCVSLPCKHGSTCNDQVNGYDCTCALGFTGKDCETDIDECRSSPCQHYSTCIDQVNAYICNCTAGYNGSTCETEIPSYTLPAAIGSVLAVAAICIIVFFIFYYYRKGSLKGLLVIGIPMVETGRGDKMRNQANQHCPGADQNAPPPFKANAAGCVLTVKKLKESGQRIIADSNRPTLVAEFKSIPMEENYDMDIGMDPANKIRNRFRNIIPYNHNRVILSGTNLDYINASYINTSRRDKEFLASQGPKPETLADFWQMIWDEDVTVIIMLTNLVEGGKRKCEQYWPDVRNQQTYGDVVTKTTKEQILPSYTLRKIKAFKNEETHTISHYHFRVWPDHGVPHTAMALLNFRNKTKSDMLSSKTPVLVHCSAGVGRTGTFIGLDLLIDEAEGRKKVNIYSCVAELRKDRPHMVQNQEQYIFLYKAMVQWATLGQTIIPCYQFEDTYGSFKTSVNSQPSQIDLQFRCLKDIKVEYSTDEVELAHSESNKTKNRNLNILPKFTCRVLLTTLTLEMNGYINAIFLDGYQKLNSFIATQTPLPDTRVEFWGMILDYQCSAIVMLCPQSMLGKDEVYAPEARGQELAFDQTTVQNEECYQDGDIIINDLIACRKGKVFQVRQFSLSEKIDHCNAPSMFVQLHSLVEKWQQQKGQTKVVVHCMDGAQWTGVFCAATCLFNQINLDQEVDVFEMVQKLKTCRPNFFTGQKQYELLYDIVQHYLRQFQTYANFQ